MAARKKNGDDAGYAVFAEDMRSQFKVFGEALQGVRDEVRGVRDEVRGVRNEVESLSTRMDRRFDRIERDVALVKTAVTEHSSELREIRTTVTRVEGALATKIDRDELDARITQALSGR